MRTRTSVAEMRLPATIRLTATMMSSMPQRMRGVSCSPKMVTPKKTAVTGSGNLSGTDLVCGSAKGSITGSGDVEFSHLLASGEVKVEVTGSGTFKINGGKAQQADYGITGSGDILAAGLEASRVDTHISGSGDIECHAVDFLKVRVSGSGDVGYKGDPELDVPKRHLHKL